MRLFFTQLQGMSQNINGQIEVAKHIRGHSFSISDTTDTWQTNRQAAELFGLRNNISLFCFDTATSTDRAEAYQMGKIDFGLYNINGLTPLSDISQTRGSRPVTALSYSYGDQSEALNYLDDVLTGRNSGEGAVPYTNNYDNLTDVDMVNRESTYRNNYYSEMIEGKTNFLEGTFQEGKDLLNSYIADTIQKGGWYTNFMHWHWWVKDYAEQYFEYLKSLVENEDVYSGSHSDIGEYYFVREAVDSVSFENGTVTINYSKKYPNSPHEKITTPLWVRVDLSGTPSAGKNITTSHGGKIRSVGNDVYYISKDLDFTKTTVSFSIQETSTPNYINLNKPVITRNGNEITADQPVKITLFSKAKTDQYQLSVVIDERQLTPADSFTLNTVLDTVNRDYYLGFINEEGVSGALEF